jgi:hypothetical protein
MTPPLLPTDIKSINRAVDNYLIADNVKQTDVKLQQLERATAQRIAPILKRQGIITLREFERLEKIFVEETRQDNLNHAFSLAQLDTRQDFIKALTGPMSIAATLGGQTLSAQLGIKLSFNPVDPATHAYLQERAAESVTGIDDTTRSRLNTIIEKDYGEGKTYQQIARDLKNDFAEYSLPGGGQRAKLIAVTELGNAHEGTKENMVRQIAQAGFKMKKFWLTLKDEKVCNICRMNMADGWIPIDQPHSSGHQRSKGHPGCRCPELYRADLPDVAGPQGDFAVKVSAFESDRSAEIITLEESAEIEYAQLDSPQFTGEPTAPTPPEEDESEQIATTKFVKRIVAALELQKGDKGDPGKDGKDGYTPIKGKDYFDGEPGYTPVKGKDYFDGKDSTVPGPPGEDSTVPGPKGDPGYTPVKGVDYQDGKDGESIKGDPGEPGPGLPPGGEPGQVPVKKSREDYDTEWQYPTGGVMWTGGNSGTQPDPATEVPLIEAGAGAIGASDKYAREDHVHPAFGGGGETPSDDDPLMDSTADPGISDEYSRGDHVHPSDTTKSDTTHNHDLAYLGLTAKAADSDKLDNHDSTYFSEATHTHATLPTADEKAALTGTSGTAPSAANPLIDDADTRLTDNRTDAAAFHAASEIDHNSLDGLDGGTAGEYYHLVAPELVGEIPGEPPLMNVVGLVYGETEYSNKGLYDDYEPPQDAGTAFTGTSLHAARRDHVHPISVMPHPTVIATTTAVKGGVFNGDFETGTKDVAVTANGVIGVNSGWYLSVSAGAVSAELDTAVCASGKASLKLEATNTSGAAIVYNTSGVTLPILALEAIPLTPSVKYRLIAKVKTNLVGASGVYVDLIQYDSAAVVGTTVSTSKLSTTNDFTILSVDFTSDNDAAFGRFALHNDVAGTVNQAWFDVVDLHRVVEDTGYTGTVPTPLLSTITGVTSTDSVDQSQLVSDSTSKVGDQSGTDYWVAQSFTPTKSKCSGISFYKEANIGTPTGNFNVSIQTDNATKPSGTIVASRELTLAQYNALSTGFNYLDMPCLLTPATLYWIVWKDTAAEANNNSFCLGTQNTGSYAGGQRGYSSNSGSTWTVDARDIAFKTHYPKPTENATIICNGDKISLSADADGILGGAIIDLDKGKYLYYQSFVNTTVGVAGANNVYASGQSTAQTAPTVISGFSLASGDLRGGDTGVYITWKVNTLLPIKHLVVSFKQYINGCYVQISPDNVNWTTLFLQTVAGYVWTPCETDLVNGLSTFYVRLGGVTLYMSNMIIEADLDTSALPIPQIYPLATNQFSDEVILPSAATRVYFRLNKYINPNGVVMPYIEFTDAAAVVIKAIPIRLDNSQETNPAIAIVKADTLYGQASGTGSDEGDNYILNDGEYMTLSTATAVPRVTYQVGKGTTAFSNITKNVIYLSSNGSSNDATKDPSHQMSVTHWYRIESITKVVSDVIRKLSDIASSLIPNSSFDIQFLIDGGGVTPSATSKGFITVPSKCVVTGWTLLGDAAGAIVVDVHSCAYSGFPTTTTIFASKPTIAATNQMAQTLGTLAIPLNKGDVLEVAVDSVTTITRCTLSLHCERVK